MMRSVDKKLLWNNRIEITNLLSDMATTGCMDTLDQKAILDLAKRAKRELGTISKIEADTPKPKPIVVAATFNTIEHTPRRFELVLQDGHKVRGIAESIHIDTEQMRTLWGKKVTVKGIGHFKPSGAVCSIEAEVIKPFDTGEELFETVPKRGLPPNLIQDIAKKQRVKSPLKEVWDKWPGDESIEEILDVLRQTSREA